jgi:hypothetical protein
MLLRGDDNPVDIALYRLAKQRYAVAIRPEKAIMPNFCVLSKKVG